MGEPRIISRLQIGTKTPIARPTELTVGMVAVSKVGPRKQLITRPQQLLDLYTPNKAISRSDHSTLMHAFAISRFAQIEMYRVCPVVSSPFLSLGLGNVTPSTPSEVVMLPSGLIADSKLTITPTIPADPGDYRSMWLQVGGILFYGKEALNPFEDGDGLVWDPAKPDKATATRITKGTTEQDLEANGLGSSASWMTYQLSVNMFSAHEENNPKTINNDAIKEIASLFGLGQLESHSFLVKEKSNKLEIYFNSETGFVTDNFKPVHKGLPGEEDPDSISVWNLTVASNPATLGSNEAPFLIASRDVGEVHNYKVWISDVVTISTEDQRFTLNVEDAVNGHRMYELSTFIDDINGAGDSLYWENFNNVRKDLVLVKNANEKIIASLRPGSNNLGKSDEYISIMKDPAKVLDLANYTALGLGDSNIRLHIITDAGWGNARIAKSLESNLAKTKSIGYWSTPKAYRDISVINAYANNFTDDRSVVYTNSLYDTATMGYGIYLDPVVDQIELVSLNIGRNNPYAATYSKNNLTSHAVLAHDFKASERDALNDAKINVAVFNEDENISYINNNWTRGPKDSLAREEQNMRAINDIQFGAEVICEQFFSKYSVEETRNRVEVSINEFFRDNIMNKPETIRSYSVVCSSENNSEITEQNNQLIVEIWVVLNHTIKEILIYTNVVPTLA